MRTIGCLFLLLGVLGLGPLATAQPAPSSDTSWTGDSGPPVSMRMEGATSSNAFAREASLFYVVGGDVTLYNKSDSTAPAGRLSLRTPVHRLTCEGAWCRVRTNEGRTGFVPATSLSNTWIRVSKQERRVYLYQGLTLVDEFEADVAYNSFADKERRGSTAQPDHWRIPEGAFYVARKNPNSQFYKALVLNYPTVDDARRGLDDGLISRAQYRAIEQAQKEFRMPPMNTELGGWIEIHGDGTGDATTWTQGCVAVRNSDMNVLWPRVRVGTPVLIE